MRKISINEIKNDNYAKLFKFLFSDEFVTLSDSAKILYSLIRDRMQLSIKNAKEGKEYWVDTNGDVFIHFTVKNIMEIMHCRSEKATKLKKELIAHNLIEDFRPGANQPNRIYVLNVDYAEKINDIRNFDNQNTNGFSKNESHEILKVESPDFRKTKPNKNKQNKTDLNKTNLNNNINNIEDEICQEDFVVVVKEIEKSLSQKIDNTAFKNTLIKNNLSLEDIKHYLPYSDRFDIKNKDNPIGFLIHLVKNKIDIPEKKPKQQRNKPEQSYNFEQREYDDDYFDNLYENI